MITPQFSEFLAQHRWAVLTSLRKTVQGQQGGPVSSVVAYAQEGDELIVSTPGSTFKRRSIEADGRVNLCVITNSEPFNFVAIEGLAKVQTEDLQAPTMAVFDRLEGTGYAAPEDLDAWLTAQRRVILRIKPQRVTGVIR